MLLFADLLDSKFCVHRCIFTELHIPADPNRVYPRYCTSVQVFEQCQYLLVASIRMAGRAWCGVSHRIEDLPAFLCDVNMTPAATTVCGSSPAILPASHILVRHRARAPLNVLPRTCVYPSFMIRRAIAILVWCGGSHVLRRHHVVRARKELTVSTRVIGVLSISPVVDAASAKVYSLTLRYSIGYSMRWHGRSPVRWDWRRVV